MEITVKQIEQFEVIPEIFKGEDNPPVFLFRTPNTIDITNFSFAGHSVHDLLFACATGFKNKPVIKDDKGNEVKYATYKELMEIGNSTVLTEIHADCAIAMTSKITEEKAKADETVKK